MPFGVWSKNSLQYCSICLRTILTVTRSLIISRAAHIRSASVKIPLFKTSFFPEISEPSQPPETKAACKIQIRNSKIPKWKTLMKSLEESLKGSSLLVSVKQIFPPHINEDSRYVSGFLCCHLHLLFVNNT